MAIQNKREHFTTTKVPDLILELAFPTIISMLITGIYNTADTFFVARVSSDPTVNTAATAAVGLVFTVMAIIQATGFLCGHGSGNYLSRMLGAEKYKEADEMASTGLALSIILGIIFAVVGNIYLTDIAQALGAQSETSLAFTKDYMRIILLGAPFTMAQFVINNQLRFQGSAYYAMIGLVCGAAINMILDPILIMGLHMQVTGAAIATVAGQVISFIVLLIGTTKGENIKLNIKNIRLNVHYIGEIINGGVPSLFRQGLAALSTLLLNREAGYVGGDSAIAGMSIAGRVLMLMLSALIGFGQGYQPVCSFNYGAGLYSRVKEGFWFCVKYATVCLLGLGALCFCFAPGIVSLFSKSPAAIEVGTAALRFQCVTMLLAGPTVMSNMMLQSIGKGFKASVTASARNGICFIPMILILPKLLGLTGVEMAQACADVLAVFIAFPLALSELKKFKD
ncbi:MAG: MATE family efflux transporter [Butyrivibrio sp.]|nr:MATE family efflux transporter [Butyrivibrio sp.]